MNAASLFLVHIQEPPQDMSTESKKHKNTRNSYETSIYNLYNYKDIQKINIYFSIKRIQNYLKYNKIDLYLLNLKPW